MFARKVSMHLNAECAGKFIKNGFASRRASSTKLQCSQSGKEVYAYSFWENNADAEKYDHAAFAQVTKLLSDVIDGALRVHTYVVANSTFHKMASVVAS
jgi:hypothetical protein